jgi:succinate-acetate transporter protein
MSSAPESPAPDAVESGRTADEVEAFERTSIVLRAYASPLPLGLFAFAVGNVLLAIAHLGGFSPADTRVAMVMLATFIAVPQFLAAVLGFLTREPLVATLLGLLAVTWPTDVVVQQYTGQMTSAPRGALFLALAGVLVLMSLPGLTAKPLFSVVVLVAALRFAAGGMYDLTASTGWMRTSGVVAVVVAVGAAYLATALVIEDVRHRTVLPVGRLGGTESRSAMEAGLASQARSLPQEAGVRAQL